MIRVEEDVRCIRCSKLMARRVGGKIEVRVKGRLVVSIERGSLCCPACGVGVLVEAGELQIRRAV